MKSPYALLKLKIKSEPKKWLITGVAGFIGSNLLEELLRLDQNVVGLDNFSTGIVDNLNEVQSNVTNEQWKKFHFIKGDICDFTICREACIGVDFVLHLAALGSVPRSINDPIATNKNNIDGFLNVLVASKEVPVRRMVYAASSSTYGDHPGLPKVEHLIGKPLSPYAVTKYVNELYAEVFASTYGFQAIGLRYFNVFGRRQNPNGPYAAVIPLWISNMINNKPVCINGDGLTSRDFCYIDNAVQANLLAAYLNANQAGNLIFNVAVGEQTTLSQLFNIIREYLKTSFPHLDKVEPIYREFRSGDVRHSLADISKARLLLGYQPQYTVQQGLSKVIDWYILKMKPQNIC